MVMRAETPMTDLRDDQIDFERVVTDPEYRRHVIVYLNRQAHGRDTSRPATTRTTSFGKSMRADSGVYPLLRRLG
jgi:hypothetical protein